MSGVLSTGRYLSFKLTRSCSQESSSVIEWGWALAEGSVLWQPAGRWWCSTQKSQLHVAPMYCRVRSFEPTPNSSNLPLQVCLLQFVSADRSFISVTAPPCLSSLRFVCEDLTVGQDSRMELFDLPICGQVGKYHLHCDAYNLHEGV